MQPKKIAGQSVSGIIVLVVVVVVGFLTGNEELIGKIIKTALDETLTVAAENVQEGEVMTIVISNTGDTILNSDQMKLEGGLDFTGKKGDSITLQRIDGVWVEIGKHLVEERDFQ